MPAEIEIACAETDAQIQACFPVFQALRPHLAAAEFLPRVRCQQAQSYRILALWHQGQVKSVAGFRVGDFLAWGRVLYIDDLATLPGHTRQGFAGALLDWLFAHARARGCQAVHLDSGYARHAAHRLYLHKGMRMVSHHFALELSGSA